ncbi:MAG TPA: SDR family oxidoreductase [Nitrososphaeraceae archaeon]
MAETILITGATGTVGSEVVKQLLSAKGERKNIKVAARSSNDSTFRNLGVQGLELDYNKPDTLSAALSGVDKLFLLTPFQSNMVDLTSNLVNEAKRAGVKYIVKQSVLGADDSEQAITPSRLHRQAEKVIEESGIPFTFLRPNFFMQNFVTFYSNFIKTQGAFYVPAGDAKASFVDVRDIAAVAVQALGKNGESKHIGKAYDITGAEALSYGEAAEILSKELAKKVNYVNISDEDTRKGMKDMGADEWTINSMIELFGIARAGYLSEISTAVKQVTGNKPTTFSQFARNYASAFK